MPSEQKSAILPLVDESLTPAQRVQALSQRFTPDPMGREERLHEMIADIQTWPRNWARTCAIYVCGKLALKELAGAVESALTLTDPVVRETAVWALHMLAPERYQQHAAELAVLDPEPRAASVTAIGDVQLFQINKEAFDEVMADRPEVAQGVIQALCQRVRDLTAQ